MRRILPGAVATQYSCYLNRVYYRWLNTYCMKYPSSWLFYYAFGGNVTIVSNCHINSQLIVWHHQAPDPKQRGVVSTPCGIHSGCATGHLPVVIFAGVPCFCYSAVIRERQRAVKRRMSNAHTICRACQLLAEHTHTSGWFNAGCWVRMLKLPLIFSY